MSSEGYSEFVEKILELGRRALDALVEPACLFKEVQELLELRDRHFAELTEVFSANSSLVVREEIRNSLALLTDQNQLIQKAIRERQYGIKLSLQSISGIQRFIAAGHLVNKSGRKIDIVL